MERRLIGPVKGARWSSAPSAPASNKPRQDLLRLYRHACVSTETGPDLGPTRGGRGFYRSLDLYRYGINGCVRRETDRSHAAQVCQPLVGRGGSAGLAGG